MSGIGKDVGVSILTGDASATIEAGDRWYALQVDERQTEWKEHGLGDYIVAVRNWRLQQGREASAQVATMKHEVRKI